MLLCNYLSLPTVASRLPVVTLLSSDAKMPLPRCEMYLAVAMSSSWNGLVVAVLKLARVTTDKRLAESLKYVAADLLCLESLRHVLDPLRNGFGDLQRNFDASIASTARRHIYQYSQFFLMVYILLHNTMVARLQSVSQRHSIDVRLCFTR